MNKKQIEEWKALYKKVYKVVISGQDYIYRTLVIGECIHIKNLINAEKHQDISDYIIARAVLYPSDIDIEKLSNDVIEGLSKYILDSSEMFSTTSFMDFMKKMKQDFMDDMQDDFFIWKVNIMTTLTGYTMKDLDSLTPHEFFRLLLLCEKISGNKMIELKSEKTGTKSRLTPDSTGRPMPVQTHGAKLSKTELEAISLEQATRDLKEHWQKLKKG